MRKRQIWLGLLGCGLWAATSWAAAKEASWRGSGGWGAGMPYAERYDAARRTTVTGEVVRVERVVPQPGMAEGYALVLRSREQLQTVHLGPVWFLERQDYAVEAHDQVEVSGSRVQLDGQTVVIAAALVKNGRVLYLREEDGLPVWSSWRRAR